MGGLWFCLPLPSLAGSWLGVNERGSRQAVWIHKEVHVGLPL